MSFCCIDFTGKFYLIDDFCGIFLGLKITCIFVCVFTV